MKHIILFFLVLTLTNCANASKQPNSNRITSKEGLIDSIPKGKHICHCFFGNEEDYYFSFPDNCVSKDSLFIFIPDTASFHETGFKRKMFNLYNDMLSGLKEQQFSGKMLAYYDKDQKHPALELNLLHGEINGAMKAWSFEGETMIERYFKNSSLLSDKKDIGNINWSYNKASNELKIDPSYLLNSKISILYSPDMNHPQMIDRDTKPEDVFANMKSLKVNGQLFSGSLLYYGVHKGFTPLPTAKFRFVNGLLDGKTTLYGDYVYVENADYPERYDAWVVKEEKYYSKGVRLSAPDSSNSYFLYKGSTFMTIDNETVYNEFELSFELVGKKVQKTGRLGLTQGIPSQYYITGGEKRNDTLELKMVVVYDSRMSSVEDALANGKRYTVRFLITGNSLKYIGDSKGCEYCPPGLILNKYDPAETDLNLYKTQSFSLPERISKDEIEDIPIDELEEFCSDTYDQLECLQRVYDELDRRLIAKQKEQLQSENKKNYKDIQEKWLKYKSKEFKFIELIFDEDGTMYPKLIVKYKTQIVKNRILEVETTDDIKEIDTLRQQLADAKTNYNTSYNSVIARDKTSNHFESLFLSAHSAWLEYKRLVILPLNDEMESSALNRHIVLLKNRTKYLTVLSNYLSTME